MAETGGNPLALLELPDRLSATSWPAPRRCRPSCTLTAGVERVFLDRCRRLPPQVQTLLLVAAADDTGQLATVRRAAAALGVEPGRPGGRGRSGLLVVDGDTVRGAAPAGPLRGLPGRDQHGNAARRTGRWPRPSTRPTTRTGTPGTAPPPPTDPTRPSSPPSTAAAARAERRGGYAAAAAAYERAAELTAGEQPRAAHLFAAARNAWAAGQTTQARSAGRGGPRRSPTTRCCAPTSTGSGAASRSTSGPATDAHRIFAAAARAVAADDPARALETGVAAALMSTYGADSGTTARRDRPRRRRHQRRHAPGPAASGSCCVAMTQASAHDWAAGLASLRAALDAGADVDDLDVLGNLGNAALHLGDDEAHRRCFTAMVADARDAGAGMLVLYALPRLGFAQLAHRPVDRAAQRRRGSALAQRQRRAAAARRGPARLADAARRPPRPTRRRLRRSCLADLDAAAGHPLGHPGRPRPRPHALGQGHPRRPRRRHPGRAAPPRPACGCQHARPAGRPRPHRRRRPRRRPRTGRGLGRSSWPRSPRAPGGRGRWPPSTTAAPCSPNPADAPALFEQRPGPPRRTPAAARTTGPAPTSPTASSCAAPSAASTPARHLRAALETFEDLRAEPLAARATQELRASGETARKRDPSTLLDAHPDGAPGRRSWSARACRTRTSPPSAGSRRGPSPSTCGTSSPRPASPPAASSPSSTWRSRQRRAVRTVEMP